MIRRAWFRLVQVAYDLFLKVNPRKLAAHAVIVDEVGRVLVLRSRYADVWVLPGGGLNRREHLDTTVMRECLEELGVTVSVEGLTGLYYHANISAYVAIFRCRILAGEIRLSHEHTEYRWMPVADLPDRQRKAAEDTLGSTGATVVHTFS
jgi:8-oxo-dGTP diphosphatase